MKDPVIMQDGHTYEREAIKKALDASPFSPLTKKPLNMKGAVPNYALKSIIEKYLNQGSFQTDAKPEQNVDLKSQTKVKNFSAEVIDDPEDGNKVFVNLTLEPEKEESRRPLLLIAMIDVSGSMQVSSSEDMKDGEEVGISRLGLVKHALKTVVSTMSSEDKVSLITFSSKANLCLEATNVDGVGKEVIFEEIKKMSAEGCTNIWDALRIGMIEAQKYKEYNTSLMLFTDGEPNENPPMGIIPTLREAISDIKEVSFTISTFAFGYNVDSLLMEEIAKIGNGVYGYCPDCTMVGTIFTSFMANILTTIEPTVSVKVKNKFFQRQFDIGGLYSGAPRHLGISMGKADFNNTEIQLYFGKTLKTELKSINYSQCTSETLDEYYRNKLIVLITDNLETKDFNKTAQEIKNLYDKINGRENKTKFMENLLIDLIHPDPNHGQVAKAFSSEYYKKWGLNYLLSFLRFHIMEQCGNFKDQSLKKYENEDFDKMRKIGNKIFTNLPPPENDCGGNCLDKQQFTNIFYNAVGGCFTGDALVELKSGVKKVRSLKKGDTLSTGAVVECLVENKVSKFENVVKINDVCFSLYHPIELEGEWVFPCQHFKVTRQYVDCWYNLVLSNKHEVVLNGVKAITLGHNRTEGVLKHPYFGTKKVIDALKKYETYESGLVSVSNLKAHRSNNLIDKYY